MATVLNPYISFNGNAAEAMDFYKSVFGGKLDATTYAGGGVPHDPAEADHIMHAMLTTEGGLVIMGADTPSSLPYEAGARISISLSGSDEAELRGYYDKLTADGGQVTVPMEKAPWGDIFGMCADKYGINWMVNVTQ